MHSITIIFKTNLNTCGKNCLYLWLTGRQGPERHDCSTKCVLLHAQIPQIHVVQYKQSGLKILQIKSSFWADTEKCCSALQINIKISNSRMNHSTLARGTNLQLEVEWRSHIFVSWTLTLQRTHTDNTELFMVQGQDPISLTMTRTGNGGVGQLQDCTQGPTVTIFSFIFRFTGTHWNYTVESNSISFTKIATSVTRCNSYSLSKKVQMTFPRLLPQVFDMH